MEKTRTAGYVLAGGRSSRMGQSKALLPWRGMTLIQHVAGAVRAAAGSVTTVGGDPAPGVRRIEDLWPGFGPVGGIATALGDSGAEWTLVVACDMPGITASFLSELLDHAEADALVPVSEDRRIHPLCAVWHRRARKAIDMAVEAGVQKATDALARVDCVWFPVIDVGVLRNVNTPEDWAQARAGAQE